MLLLRGDGARIRNSKLVYRFCWSQQSSHTYNVDAPFSDCLVASAILLPCAERAQLTVVTIKKGDFLNFGCKFQEAWTILVCFVLDHFNVPGGRKSNSYDFRPLAKILLSKKVAQVSLL